MPLYWEEVPCEEDDGGDAPSGGGGEEEEASGWLPWWIVYPVQFIAWLWDMHIVMIIIFPWWLMLFSVAMIDYVLDLVFWLLFGWYCEFCAGIFIWIVNIAHLPFWIWGWLQRIFLEVFSFIIDGWMLFLGGSGCFLWFGYDCHLMGWEMYWIFDVPWFTADLETFTAELNEKLSIPKVEKPSDFWTVREKSRAEFMSVIPLVSEVYAMARYANDHISF